MRRVMMCRNKKRRLIEMPDLTYPQRGLCHFFLEEAAASPLPGPRRGFTVIEILIVMVIITIAALTAVPMMSSASSVQIRSAASMIAADLEYAKSMAISRGQNYSVLFDQNADSYQLEDQNNNVIQHPVKKGFDYIVDFQSDTRLNRVDITGANFSGNSDVEFDSMGSPDSGGTVSLQAGGTTVTIMVEPITGYISIN
jgi:prepilin-type N-terminal cleavage/methylation domain-containing protein